MNSSAYTLFILACITIAFSTSHVLRVAAQPASGNWSDPATWGGALPVAGDAITIPAGQSIILDTDSPPLAGLTVIGELLFAEQDVALTANWIAVSGLLQIGSEAAPFQHRATITLTGTDEAANIFGSAPLNSGNKFLMAHSGGHIAIHGSSRDKVSWTQLNVNANIGDSSITLAEPVDWIVGDELVIAPSGFNPDEAEQVTVTSVVSNVVSFTPALQYAHWGELQSIAGRELDERAEVGLLSRNILIQGAADSLASNFGGHVMVMPNSSAQIEGVELFRMGQMGHAARYPLHWHLLTRMGDGSVPTAGQYAKNNSIHHSFHRGIVIHGTNDILVEKNVAYDVWSHTFVPAEDGDEVDNPFIGNLGVLTRRLEKADRAFAQTSPGADRTIQSEHRPATFWLRNPFNELVGNHAAGGERSMGFFYDTLAVDNLLLNAIHDNADPIVFEDNVAHSYYQEGGSNDLYPPFTSGHGLFVENIGRNHQRLFSNFTAYKNYSGAWIEDSTQLLRNARMADNAVNIVNFRAVVEGATIVGQSANVLDNDNKPPVGRLALGGGMQVMRAYGGSKSPVLRDSTFVNMSEPLYVYLDDLSPDESNAISGVTVLNSSGLPAYFDRAPDGALRDTDGSLSGTGQPSLIMSEGSNLITDECAHMPEWQAYVCPDESVTPTAVTLLQSGVTDSVGQFIGLMVVLLAATTAVHLRMHAIREW